ncbi:Tat pathway signal protein [Natronorubrum sp. JWXQ-INN-674]|uniref:Tat pathway signal protein n=1 Tax=Natronorubrum halalkaliphilum TaxID=2691917 RepID=A0A6B0VR85_9EURY|nr:Tat pathway signal protein [Natronorubrum halalkaliphilum]MXV64341.1 Tat pathway signal protein [Natronorubrum halalkaliphilum]
MTLPDRSSLSRRDYLRALVAVGGATALSACVSESDDVDVPTGTDDPDSLPARQHAWNDALSRDDHGNVQPPEHHVLVALSLIDEPSDDGRERVEDALEILERAYEWSNEGLVFTLGYTPAYFDRFDDSLPETVDLPEPEPLTDREDPTFDEFDAVLHLASDRSQVVLEAEAGLFGEADELNGVDVETGLTGVFERVEDQRRTGFVGEGLPAEHTELSGVPDSIPDEAPFFMGFRSGFDRSQATEDRVTIEDGPFGGGTTQQISSMDLQLRIWFEQDNHYQRVTKMFSPEHADEELVGDIGEALTSTNALTDERIESTQDDARTRGVVGHAQKAARARVDGEPPLLRRDFNTVDGESPGLHFLSLQEDIEAFVRVREAMTGDDLGVANANNGIRSYIFVTQRGNYLIPPRSLRALPPANPTGDDSSEET